MPDTKSLNVLADKIRARSFASNMVINALVKAGLPVQIIKSELALAARLVRTGAIARRALAYAGKTKSMPIHPQCPK